MIELVSHCEPTAPLITALDDTTKYSTDIKSDPTSEDYHRKLLFRFEHELIEQGNLWDECYGVLNVPPGGRLPRDAGAYPDDLRGLAERKPVYRIELNEIAAFIEQRLKAYYGDKPMSEEAKYRSQSNKRVRAIILAEKQGKEGSVSTSEGECAYLTPSTKRELVDHIANLGYTIPSPDINREWIYVLKLDGDNYYVGKSKDPLRRLLAHFRGNKDSPIWIQEHKAISLVTIVESVYTDHEEIVAREYVRRYGQDKVRGTKCGRAKVTSLSQNTVCEQCGHSVTTHRAPAPNSHRTHTNPSPQQSGKQNT